ncbi:MAG: alkaline phosphatase, partial [Flavobacteriaceae bacterium]|nr:alkaline phosphatase [Flavobacteriaceae bacterium]
MKFYFSLFAFIFLNSFFISCQEKEKEVITSTSYIVSEKSKKPKNIILLIGDGMGLSEISASQFYNKEKTNFERFPVIGLIKTSSSSDVITDSAAGATAFSAGIKTYNGAIGVDKDSLSVETIVEQISKKNIASGVVSTSSITHATPASFYAHSKMRRMHEDIATDMVASDIEFFAGGGLDFFKNRKDQIDLIAQLKNKGFDIITDKLPTTASNKKQAILLAGNAMPKMLDGRGDFLPNATKLALETLSKNEEGFFLMVEGSQIDWGGHDNDADYLISELIDFDKTIGVALEFAKQNGETLVIVTADHETGGFTLASDNNDYNKIKPVFSTNGHSATMVPVFAKGPSEAIFGGIYENTAIYTKMYSLFLD